ncbi:hypothetical protein RB628_22205 [Streptomyces sp. ADMS]|uniref:hypothetical protein n=1 Tax=Streptomyces sp. ADMS TaxID=3071415 RepID=UPI00296E2743|nr:hypothetical protein [Streptomyces sp. ADMS]MDW4907985.1 hypothetical protein [Streptomyces sp. ADMS]
MEEPDDVTPEHALPDGPPPHPAHDHPRPHPQPFAAVPHNQRPPVWPGDPELEEPEMPVAWSMSPPGTAHSRASDPYAVWRAQRADHPRRPRLSLALGAAALVVALGAGASLVALLDGDDGTAVTPPTTAPGESVPSPTGPAETARSTACEASPTGTSSAPETPC